jgi:PhoPQ-activated pathogenicity-related protein
MPGIRQDALAVVVFSEVRMTLLPSSRLLPFVLAGAVLGLRTAPLRADLHQYVKTADPSFSWKLKEKIDHPLGTVYDLELVSQTWHDITWKHQLQVYQPRDVAPNKTMLVWVWGGGGANVATTAIGMELAKKLDAPCAFLYHVPNQPLFDGKTEDALIAETFVRCLKDKDDTWPLLLPMVKSTVKAMDALQAFTREEWAETPVESFVITGGSKRGWTTWLTGASDPRVKAIAPMVFDMLNMKQQIPHQIEAFGKPSDQIHDYTDNGLTNAPDTAEVQKLFALVDPYSYRDKLTQPKLLILGNNDPYWTTDALNLYWDGLKGNNRILYVPNAAHNLRQKEKGPEAEYERVINGLAAFTRAQTEGKGLPKLEWKHDDTDGKLRLTVKANPAPKAARLWEAEASTLDFRKSPWVEKPTTIKDGTVTGEVATPTKGCLAFYGELEYEIDGIKYVLTTQIRVAGKPEK